MRMRSRLVNRGVTMIKAFINGVIEFRSSYTTRYEDLDLAYVYDLGRELAHKLTFRRYEP